MLTESYEEKKAALDTAISRAFKEAIKADSIQRINRLLSSLDHHTRELQGV